MDRERSYYALYRGDIVKALQENNINRYIILNEQLISIYVDDDFDESILTNFLTQYYSNSFYFPNEIIVSKSFFEQELT